MIEEYKRRSEIAIAPAKLGNYVQIIALFARICGACGYRATPPVSPHIAAEYVDFLGRKINATMIEARLWAIGEMHRAEF